MAGQQVSRESRSGRVSRAPVVVLLGALGLALVLVLLGAALASAPAPAPSITIAGTDTSPRAVNVILRDYRFDPTPLFLVPGETVRLSVLNGGMVEHELALGDASFQAAWAAADALATPPAPFATAPPASASADVTGLRLILPSGGHTVVDYRVPADQDLELICHLPGHAERGMIGQVTMLIR